MHDIKLALKVNIIENNHKNELSNLLNTNSHTLKKKKRNQLPCKSASTELHSNQFDIIGPTAPIPEQRTVGRDKRK